MTELIESAFVDELPVKSLLARYGVARSQIYNRINALGIVTVKRDKNKAYVTADQLALLDRIHQLIQEDHTLEAAAAKILGQPTRQSYETAGQYLIHKPGSYLEQSHETAGQLEMLQALMAAIAHQQPAAAPAIPPANPLSRFEQLQAIADNDWRPSTSELADILGLNSLSGSKFERYGFRFTRAGKNGAQSAWRVEKVDG